MDQDALDFLKKFFSFKDLHAVSDPSGTTTPEDDGIYFRETLHILKMCYYLKTFATELAEIFPIDLKLDYKPRRVDYRALREGRTIELMNFFHFDGAEMTLRHITLNGVSIQIV